MEMIHAPGVPQTLCFILFAIKHNADPLPAQVRFVLGKRVICGGGGHHDHLACPQPCFRYIKCFADIVDCGGRGFPSSDFITCNIVLRGANLVSKFLLRIEDNLGVLRQRSRDNRLLVKPWGPFSSLVPGRPMEGTGWVR